MSKLTIDMLENIRRTLPVIDYQELWMHPDKIDWLKSQVDSVFRWSDQGCALGIKLFASPAVPKNTAFVSDGKRIVKIINLGEVDK